MFMLEKRKGKSGKGKRKMQERRKRIAEPNAWLRGWSCRELGQFAHNHRRKGKAPGPIAGRRVSVEVLFWELPRVSPGHPCRGSDGPGPAPSRGARCISTSTSASAPVPFAPPAPQCFGYMLFTEHRDGWGNTSCCKHSSSNILTYFYNALGTAIITFKNKCKQKNAHKKNAWFHSITDVDLWDNIEHFLKSC